MHVTANTNCNQSVSQSINQSSQTAILTVVAGSSNPELQSINQSINQLLQNSSTDSRYKSQQTWTAINQSSQNSFTDSRHRSQQPWTAINQSIITSARNRKHELKSMNQTALLTGHGNIEPQKDQSIGFMKSCDCDWLSCYDNIELQSITRNWLGN